MLQPRQCFKVLFTNCHRKIAFSASVYVLSVKSLSTEVTSDPALFQQTWLYYYCYYCTISAAAATAVVTSPRACLY